MWVKLNICSRLVLLWVETSFQGTCLHQLCQARKEGEGFWLVHDEPNSALVLPAGYITVVVGNFSDDKDDDGAHGMRWSILDTASLCEVRRAQETVAEMIAAFPELAGGDYETWKTLLSTVLLPASTM
jgi:hypothetical protein